jgi:septal ring factor EnvC (AmiA/AmiB activator)
MKKLILPILFMLFMAVGVLAQSPTPSPTPTDADVDLMQRAQMVAEIKMLREKTAGLQTQVSELKTQVEVYKKLDTVQEARIADLKEALKYRTEARDVNQQVEAIRLQQIEDYKIENKRLRDENTSLRKSRDRRSLIFGAIGLVAGKFIW